jgi:hypothetical protein
MDSILAWHFVGKTLRDGSPIPRNGRWLKFTGPIEICKSGLHASRQPFDALSYAPGPVLCLVECAGIVTEQDDKLVCSDRKIIERWDATEMLRYFARMQALSVTDNWDPPDVVCDWLMTGDEAAESAARSAAARSAAESAARSAESAARSAAAWSAAESAARSAAAWSAAESAARSAESAAREDFNQTVYNAFADYLDGR